MPTATRKPKTRTLCYSRLTGILHLTQEGKQTGFYLDALATDFGPEARAYRVTKIIPTADGSPRSYDVLLAPDGDDCTCLGWQRWSQCRHQASLRCLRSRGDLS